MFGRVVAARIMGPLNASGVLSFILVFVLAVILSGSAAADFDSADWRRFRAVRIPAQFPDGLAGIPLESDVINKCRQDMADLRIATSDGAIVPLKVIELTAGDDGEPFPARVFRMARKQGKWTDIWIDKQAKILTQGILIQTPSKDFLRRVEIRGSDNVKETYVVSMDGLIADISGPMPLRSLNVMYHVNNFQYVHIRIIDDDKPPLKVEGVLCYPPPVDSHSSWPVEARIRENRSDPSTGSTTIIADLGEKRFPVASIRISSAATEFVKKATIYAAVSQSSESWKRIFEGTLFRIRREEAVKESLEVKFKAQTSRYLKVELSGGSRGAVAVDKLQAAAAVRVAAFQYRQGQDYRLYFDNPNAKPMTAAAETFSMNVTQLTAASSEIGLGPEQRNIVAPPAQKTVNPGRDDASRVHKILGIAVLLIGLLLLFIIMLKARSSKRSHGRRGNGAINTGF